ncbi:MAG: aspartate carbamoyltransferase regulatory subunit [Candidatus Micrarchaeota archaeon]|nr:aspartate carbamoyltransferase regulatory subunit [Candidatus Micrarchaeota archaeon]
MAEVKLEKIRDGTVIDHVPAGRALQVLRVLGVDDKFSDIVALLMNVESRRTGRKDVIKVENKVLSKEETDRLALVAPNATINIIKSYEVRKKTRVELPKEFVGIVKCANPQCVTNHEPVATRFSIESNNPIQLRCRYCERTQ